MALTLLVRTAQRRLRLGDVLGGVTAGLVAVSAAIVLLGVVWGAPVTGAAIGTVVAAWLVGSAIRRAARRWTAIATAEHIEARAGGLDNLLVTATALSAGAINASVGMGAEVTRQAAARASAVQPSVVVPLGTAAWLTALAAGSAVAVAWTFFAAREPGPRAGVPGSAPARLQSIRATVTPPAYLGRQPEVVDDPELITIPAGGRVRLDVRAGTGRVWLEEPAHPIRPLVATANGAFSVEWTPEESTAMVVAVGEHSGAAEQSRVVQLAVVHDQAPRVRIVEPGHDLGFGDPSATVDVAIDASDAEGLDGLRLTYVKMSGSGESFEFAEGRLPVEIERTSPLQWRGRARLSLPALQLQDGDSLVYRAQVRDSNPHGAWVSSDAFTIDVGKRLEFAGAGFAVPDEDRRYAISQQMVIVKTERLLADRGRPAAEPWAERTRMLGMEQRMVRAEVVFLSGGEIQDEVEEAEHSHELQEGRLENAGRAEMLKAINEMSRAEARLNAGDAAGALVFERAALVALQRAFDRRRYFLRTLAERSRIDPTRRLTGNLTGAQSRTRAPVPVVDGPESDLRSLLEELARVAVDAAPASPSLLARLASLEPSAGDWRQLAAALAAASTASERRDAAQDAMARVAAYARMQAGPSTPAPALGALRGWWRDEWPTGRRP